MIFEEKIVEQAYIHLGPDEYEPEPLTRVDGEPYLWKCSLFFPGDPIKDSLKYRYGMYKKKHNVHVPFVGKFGYGKDFMYCEEAANKRVSAQVQFDVFCLPDDKQFIRETTPKAVVFYLKWLLPLVHPSSICDTLSQIKNLNFSLLRNKYVKFCIDWIVEQALDANVTNPQRLYLCIILGHLKRFSSPLQLPRGKKIAKACDHLLDCLVTSVYSNFLSASDLILLENIAVLLVENSSSPGWLTLAAYFYPYLGVEFILLNKYVRSLNYRYDDVKYHRMVGLLLINIKIKSRDDQITHKDLLGFLLKNAPTLDDALKIFTSPEARKFFENDEESANFFFEFYHTKLKQDGTQNKSAGDKLVEFFKIPNNIREKMHEILFAILLEYSKSDEELKDEQVNIFLTSIILDEDLDMDQVLEILSELAKSYSFSRQDLLLDILDNELFQKDWQQTSLEEKVNICRSWVITRVKNERWGNRLGGVSKIAAVYGAIDAIMKRSLNIANRALIQEVSSFVVETVLRNEDAISVLKAFHSIEKYVIPVQDFYKNHLRKILGQAPNVVKKSSNILEECSSSRYVHVRFYLRNRGSANFFKLLRVLYNDRQSVLYRVLINFII